MPKSGETDRRCYVVKSRNWYVLLKGLRAAKDNRHLDLQTKKRAELCIKIMENEGENK